jgi:glycosyltransferase involved in cell wall biosynthesis
MRTQAASLNWGSKSAVVIPCFNEDATIGSVVTGVKAHVSTVIVVNDGSLDKTAEAAKAADAIVLDNQRNLGKGASLRVGWNHALQIGFSWALSLDGDGQHSPDDIPSFFDCAERESAQLVVGNRMSNPTGMPWIRHFVNGWMSRRLSKAAGAELPDSQCGFRLMDLKAWSRLPIHCDRFEIESELLLAFLKAGHRVSFVPIRTVYKSEQSKINPISDTIRWFKWWRKV